MTISGAYEFTQTEKDLIDTFAKLVVALEWAIVSARLDVERYGNALSGPSITQSMMEEYGAAKARLDHAETALALGQKIAANSLQ